MYKFALTALIIALLLPACSQDREPSTAIAPSTAITEVQTAEVIPLELASPDIRPEVGGLTAAVVSEHPLASQIGYEVLRAGGNAIDAAVSMAGALTVLRPHMNSIGGDSFLLYYEASSREIHALNASGRAASLATPELFHQQEMQRVPFSGPLSITVPGAVSGWHEALTRFGSLSMAEALRPAIAIAENGFMVSTTLAADLASAAPRLNDAGQLIYMNGDTPIASGEILKSSDMAASLRLIAEQGPSVIYGGELGERIATYLESQGSPLRLEDFSNHTAEWSTPASISFRDRTFHTVRPNSQGVVLLQMLGMLESLPLHERENNSAELLHEMIEITKLAFADRDHWVADPAMADMPIEQMLDKTYLGTRAGLITTQAMPTSIPGLERSVSDHMGDTGNEAGDTVYFMVVDKDGNAVSWIQSIFGSFGSNIVVPGTGIVMQNRGAGFTLEEGHPNQIAPGKRPFHTLMAGMVTDADGNFEMTIGTPGGGGQPQFIFQTLAKTVVFGMTPQQAVESPRFRIGSGTQVSLESRIDSAVHADLVSRGHTVESTEGWTAEFGSMQVIQRLPSGVLRTGADMRREAAAMAY
jgi:gamma-glutamyltranspeptidase / glutathione hydrolase